MFEFVLFYTVPKEYKSHQNTPANHCYWVPTVICPLYGGHVEIIIPQLIPITLDKISAMHGTLYSMHRNYVCKVYGRVFIIPVKSMKYPRELAPQLTVLSYIDSQVRASFVCLGETIVNMCHIFFNKSRNNLPQMESKTYLNLELF